MITIIVIIIIIVEINNYLENPTYSFGNTFVQDRVIVSSNLASQTSFTDLGLLIFNNLRFDVHNYEVKKGTGHKNDIEQVLRGAKLH